MFKSKLAARRGRKASGPGAIIGIAGLPKTHIVLLARRIDCRLRVRRQPSPDIHQDPRLCDRRNLDHGWVISAPPTATTAHATSGICLSGRREPALPTAFWGERHTPPTISGKPVTRIALGETYVFTPTAADADGQLLSFGIRNAPPWADFNEKTGRLRGQPSKADVGLYDNIVVFVTDGAATDKLDPFSINVVAKSTAASEDRSSTSLSGIPTKYGEVGRLYSFEPELGGSQSDTLISPSTICHPGLTSTREPARSAESRRQWISVCIRTSA